MHNVQTTSTRIVCWLAVKLTKGRVGEGGWKRGECYRLGLEAN
jgi:hypothetical protein